MTAHLLFPAAPADGPQPLDLTRHLAGVADLIEVCFAPEMDDGGRSFIRELRFLGQFGVALRLLAALGLNREIWTQGFVWVDQGRVVGSVNTQLSGTRPAAWLIANVAVHPDHRRRGIAQALMQATLDFIRRQGGREANLEVELENSGALKLYQRLGFSEIAQHTSWVRSGRLAAPAHAPSPFDIRPRGGREWLDEFNLAQRVRAEGAAWNRPLSVRDYRPSAWRQLERTLNGQAEEHWLALTVPGGQLAGALAFTSGLVEGDRLTLLAHPHFRGQVERPLLVRALRRLEGSYGPQRLEHPGEDQLASATLRDLGFTVQHTRRWMRKIIG